MCFRIEIDQLYCVSCWVIIHCLLSVVWRKITRATRATRATHSWYDRLYNWPPNSELLPNYSLLKLIYFLSILVIMQFYLFSSQYSTDLPSQIFSHNKQYPPYQKHQASCCSGRERTSLLGHSQLCIHAFELGLMPLLFENKIVPL